MAGSAKSGGQLICIDMAAGDVASAAINTISSHIAELPAPV